VPQAPPEPGAPVVTQGGAGATCHRAGAGRLPVPAPAVDVVAHAGAGDALAAGFPAARLRGLPPEARLRPDAPADTVPGDLAVPPVRSRLDALAALDGPAWGTLRLSAGLARQASAGAAAVRGGERADERADEVAEGGA
jgi:2-dehydro-3-deoxygluconokinase